MINILFIAPRFGTIDRGVEVFVYELAKRLPKHLFKITILSSCHDIQIPHVHMLFTSVLKREYSSAFFKIFSSRLLTKLKIGGGSELESLSMIFSSVFKLKKNTYDLIIPVGGWWTYLLAKLIKCKGKIVSIGHAGPCAPDIKLSDVFVALTPYAKAQAEKMHLNKHIVLIPNGVDTEKFYPKENTLGKKQILCVAAFTGDKRHDLLLDAVALLPRTTEVVFMGKGSLQQQLEQHPTCATHTVVFSSMPFSEMITCYSQATVMTLASPGEAFGLVFLEAMACGLNVVAHHGERQRFVCGNEGFYVNVYDKYDYADGLTKALNICKPEKNRIHAEQFSWNVIVKMYEDLFQQMHIPSD